MKTFSTEKRHNSHIPRPYVRLFWIILLIIIWELSVKLFGVPAQLFPSVETVAKTLWESLTHGDLLIQIAYSLWIIILGMCIALLLAVIMAFLSTSSRISASFIDTLTAIMHPLPGLALLPLIILWFGTGSSAILAIIVHSALWPLLINLISGIAAVPMIYIDCARNLSMSQAEISAEILPRSAATYIISGLRIGWARSWRALISAEMVFGAVGSKGGIGWYILKQRTFMNTAGLFAGIIVVVILGLIIEDCLFSWIEKNTIQKWGMQTNGTKY